jgi:hypothetical protein
MPRIRIHRALALSSLACVVALLVAAPALSQQSTQPAPATASAAPAASVDPAAVTALETMSAALRKLTEWGLSADTTTELVLQDGQKVQMDGVVTYKVKEPGMLFAEVKSERRHRQYFYDGKNFTLWSPMLNFYATIDGVNAPLRDLGLRLAQQQKVELPLLDLFLWGTQYADKSTLTSAIDIGPTTVHGRSVDHFAYRQPSSDWQVWIDTETRLPVKLVITSMDDPERPQYTALLRWDAKTHYDDATFRFRPPAGANKITFAQAKAAAATKEK